jgi:predicted RNase H-like nuclease (RuvC/YqgF family)
MHIFIVSNIIEHTFKNNVIATSTTIDNIPQKNEEEIEKIKSNFEAQIATLRAQQANNSTTSSTVLTDLQNQFDDLNKKIKEKDTKINELNALLQSYKELLLDSTQLIFRMDDINMS